MIWITDDILAEKDETGFWLRPPCQHNTDNPDLPNGVWIRSTFYWNRKCYFRPSFQVVNLGLNIGFNWCCCKCFAAISAWLVFGIKELEWSNNGEPLILMMFGWLKMERGMIHVSDCIQWSESWFVTSGSVTCHVLCNVAAGPVTNFSKAPWVKTLGK